MSTTLEKTIEAEQAAHDADRGADAEAHDQDPPVDGKTGQVSAFDRDAYQDPALRIEKVDDHEIDKIRIDFTGSVMLDRRNPSDVAFFNRLILGREVDLTVAGVTSGKATGYTTGKEGDLDAVVGKTTIKVHSITTG